MRGIATGMGCRFNPLPAFRPGDTLTGLIIGWLDRSFNPLPAFRPGDTRLRIFISRASRGFNPLPAFRPGDTLNK